MKNVILTCLLTCTVISLSFAQLKVVAPDGNVGIGTSTPGSKLQVDGILRVLPIDGQDIANGVARMEVGGTRTSSGKARIDLFADPGNWSARFQSIINPTGDLVSTFSHKGSGNFVLRTFNTTSDIQFVTTSAAGVSSGLTVKPNGFVGLGTDSPSARLHVNGSAVRTDGMTTWDVPSDLRLKNILGDYDKGIEAVMQLNPVVYKYKGNGGIEDTETERVGFIAQEYQKVAPNSVKPFKYTELISEEGSYSKVGATEEYLSINTSDVTFMLVNAVKEQQAIIKDLKDQVSEMAKVGFTAPTATDHVHYSTVVLSGQDDKAMLAQNAPNPFTRNTKIDYYIPSNSRAASLSFTDITGKEVKRISIDHTGLGSLDVSIEDMPIGIYSYSLVVNGSTIASKKMVLSK